MRARRLALLASVLFLFAAPRPVVAQGGVPLGPEFRVNTYTTFYQAYPAIAFDSAGNFVVVWEGQGQNGDGILAQRFSATGMPLGGEFRVNTFTGAARPAVASDSAGNFVVVWHSSQGGTFTNIFGQRYANTGAPLGPEFRVNTYTADGKNKRSADVASDAAGNFVVAWDAATIFPGEPTDVNAQRYASTGSPLGGEFTVNTSGFHRAASVACDPVGNFMIVWENPADVAARRYSSAGTPLGAEFLVNTFIPDLQAQPRVASDSSGNFVVVWESLNQDGNFFGVFGQRYASSGTPLGPEFRVNTFTPDAQRFPSVAADAAGNFVVAWQTLGPDGSSFGVSAQRYLGTGVPLGGEFGVNSYTTSAQLRPSVAGDAAGAFVVVWASYTQDGQGPGVFGQRYNLIVPVELLGFTLE